MEALSLSYEASNRGLSTHYRDLRGGFSNDPDFINTKGTSTHLRCNSRTLAELSEELKQRTQQTEKLQELVDNETREALERFGCSSATNSSPESSCYYQGFPASNQRELMNNLLGVDDLNHECVAKSNSSPTNELSDTSINACQHHLLDLQLSKEASSPQALMIDLQSRLHNVQVEKDKLLDLRVKDSKNHRDQMEKMLCILEENVKSSSQQTLQETEDETSALNRDNAKSCSNDVILQSVSGNSNHFDNERETLQEKILSMKDKWQGDENNEQNNKERMESLISDLGQEMEVLTHHLSSFKNSGCSLGVKLELLKTLAERQTSLHQNHISKLEKLVASHKDKVSGMEQRLLSSQIQLYRAETERDQLLQQAQMSQFAQLQRCCEEQQCEFQDQIKVLKGQLELTTKQLHKAGKETSCLQALLEKKDEKREQTLELLKEKEKEVWTRQQETQQCHAKLEAARSQHLQDEMETLKFRLNDKDKMIDVLRQEMESNDQMVLKHRMNINRLQKENSLLSNQLKQHKQAIQQLMAELDQQKTDVTAAELRRQQLQASETEQSQHLHEQTVERQQLQTVLELYKNKLNTLTRKHKELQQAYSCEAEEHNSAVMKLQIQLRSTHDELEQIRSTQGTLQGADGHALQVALDMQKEVTARREQVDSMQSTIQLLKENVEKLHQGTSYQNLRAQRKQQELVYVKEEKKHLASEMESLRSKDQQLRDRICDLEALLHKISKGFANCQDFMQLQEQEYFRLKLQHALDLKELQGQTVQSVLNTPSPDVDSLTPATLTAPISSQKDYISKNKAKTPVSALRSPAEDLRGVTTENGGPHTHHSFYRRRSAPERERMVTICERDQTRGRRKTCSRRTQSNRPALKRSISESYVVAATAGSQLFSSHLLSPGRKSPVYCLLTSDPTRELGI